MIVPKKNNLMENFFLNKTFSATVSSIVYTLVKVEGQHPDAKTDPHK